MMQKFTDKLGNWNPQLLREIKGRIKPRNVLLTIFISLVSQFLLVLYFQTQIITEKTANAIQTITNEYCTGEKTYINAATRICLQDELGNIIINWESWFRNIFTWLSIIACFAILVAGTYLIISDLANEQRRETLNFIRLSPLSPQSILLGKMLGVPILLYFAVLLAIPLHLWSGLAANIPLVEIFSFYAVIVAAGILYYSGGLLFGLVGSWLSGFQAWLGSGGVLGFLILTRPGRFAEIQQSEYPFFVLKLINPTSFIPNYSVDYSFKFVASELANYHWFAIPLGATFVTIIGFALFIYLMTTWFIWHSLQRCFRDPNATMLSKKQSYLLTSCFAILTIGCANWQKFLFANGNSYTISENLTCLLVLNLWLFLYLIAALNPHRQTLYDWARYRHIYSFKEFGNSKLIKDLIWSEKSPGLVAIALNTIIAITALSLFILLSGIGFDRAIPAFLALIFAGNLTMIYAGLAQLMLLMKTEQPVLWATGTVGAVMILPLVIVAMLFSNPENNTLAWLFSIAAPLVILYPTGHSESFISVFLAVICQWMIIGLLVFLLMRYLRKAGESAKRSH
ncbi:hypothetical protein NIES4075_18110 [Tolypothrix sp. NIES-4075]|uniref:hypothetical protein n=1 Tax=Tolypothrix sp. NIES-4075 TaxID=2005459 RepID=UPI000B5C853E|nr:hypothetical protein [Tolypothrix sp. NIES-4075]GAX40845.1 hypothetical protein NIES4075_18110 [Tolypothrix sp. NIES-4075]